MSVTHLLNALARLEGMATAGLSPDDLAHEAELIAAGWWWDGRGELGPDRLVLLVQELRCWCVAASGRHAMWGEDLHRVGRPMDADDTARWARALDRAQQALLLYS